MNAIDIYFIRNKKAKFAVYLILYLLFMLAAQYCFRTAANEYLALDGSVNKMLISLSFYFSCMTFSMGFFFFLGYDFFEKTVFNIVGYCIMITLTILHLVFNCGVGIITLEAFLLGCPDGYGWIFGFATASHLYALVVCKIYRVTTERYVSESKKMLIQILLPLACFLIMSFFISFSIGIFCLFVVGFVFVDSISNKKTIKMARITKKQRDVEATKRAAFGNDEEAKY